MASKKDPAKNNKIGKTLVRLMKVEDKKALPPNVEHKVLTKLEKIKRKRIAAEKAKEDLAKLNKEEK